MCFIDKNGMIVAHILVSRYVTEKKKWNSTNLVKNDLKVEDFLMHLNDKDIFDFFWGDKNAPLF